jgi:hypothetical protein
MSVGVMTVGEITVGVMRQSRNAMLSFAPHDEMKDETPYFQNQNISFSMQVIERDYKDVIILEPLNVNAKKIHIVRDCFKEVSALHEWCSDGIFRIETKLKEMEGRSGYKESEDFWRKLYRTNASLVKQDVEKCFNHLQKLCDFLAGDSINYFSATMQNYFVCSVI